MLYSAELRLRVVQSPGSGGVTGYHLLAFFLHLLETANPALAAALHKDDGPKPFTLSPLGLALGKQRPLLQEGTLTSFRVTALNEEVFASLADAVWRLPGQMSLPLGDARVSCQGLATTPDQSRWAGFSSFPQLWENAVPEDKLRLAFLTPTTFRSKGKRNVLFPEPSLVFGSLLARWNAYAPASLRLSPDENSIEALRLSGYRLSTRMLDFGSYQELGFQGQVTYELAKQLPEEQMRALNALVDFAFFSGVGAKTTMGMGQCRRLANARALSHRARGDSKERR